MQEPARVYWNQSARTGKGGNAGNKGRVALESTYTIPGVTGLLPCSDSGSYGMPTDVITAR